MVKVPLTSVLAKHAKAWHRLLCAVLLRSTCACVLASYSAALLLQRLVGATDGKDSHSKSELTSRYNKVSKFLGSSFQQSVHGIFLFFVLNIRSSFADVAEIEKAFCAT